METAGYPVAYGHWQVQRRGLVCRLPEKTVTVRAPSGLLRAVQGLCDGQLAWKEVAAELAVRWSAGPVEAFLAELRMQGLLVDADGEVATFADQAIDAQALSACLREAQERLGRRAEWWVAVLRELDGAFGRGVSRGIYRASVGVDGQAVLDRRECHLDKAWHLLEDPRILTFASAVIAPIDVDTSELSEQGDWSVSTAVACAVRGDLRVDTCRSPFAQTQHCVVLGAAASRRDLAHARAARSVPLRAASFPTAMLSQGFAFIAGPVPSGHGDIFTTGRAADALVATRKAEAEAWERRGWAHLGPVVNGPMGEVPGAINPQRVVAYSDEQHLRADFPFARFKEDAPYLWRTGCDVATAAPVALPAECIHALSALPRKFQLAACTGTSTSGMAAGTDVESALCRATLELIERDAFLRCWLRGRSLPVLARESLPSAALRQVQELEALDLRVEILQVPTDLACVFAVFIQGRKRALTAVTAAAEFHPEGALIRALNEAQGRAAHAAAFPARPAAAGDLIRGPADISRYYQSPRTYREADFLVGPEPGRRFGAPLDAASTWLELQSRLAQTGHRIYAFDLTPPGAAIDQGRAPLHVIRAVVPGLLPIWFGTGLEPAGLPAFQSRLGGRSLSELPVHPFT